MKTTAKLMQGSTVVGTYKNWTAAFEAGRSKGLYFTKKNQDGIFTKSGVKIVSA